MFEITISWWMVPTTITILSFIYPIFIHDDGGGFGAGIGNILMCIPALFISLISWIVYAVLK